MAAGQFGAYGKIPALGDFFRLNVSQGFVEAWDEWLQGALVQGRAAHGADWTDHYMTAPIWRFSVAAGFAGAEAVTGVLMPSVDRVGRQFPLTLVAPVATDQPLRTLALQEAALARLELIALDALDDGMTRDGLAERLSTVELAPWVEPSVVRAVQGGYIVSAQDALGVLPDLALRLGPKPEAVFSTAVEGRACLLAMSELPGSATAAALFDINSPLWTEGRA